MGMSPEMLPPVPSRMGGATPPPQTEAPPLASAPQEAPQSNEVQDRARTIMRQLGDQRRTNDGLAAQYPSAAKHLRTANEALKQAMLIVIREVQQMPGSSPAPAVGPG